MSANRIVHKVTLKYLLLNRKRTLFSLVSIVLMVILMTCVFIGRDTVINSFVSIAEAEKGRWHVNLYEINAEQYEEIAAQPFVREYGISEHLTISQYPDSPNETRPYLDLRSYSANSMDWMNLTVTEGRKPEKDDEIMLSEALRKDGSSLQIGEEITFTGAERFIQNNSEYIKVFPFQQVLLQPYETIEAGAEFPYFNDPEIKETLEADGFEKTYTVVGFMEIPSFESASSAGYTAVTFNDNTPPAGTFNLSLRITEEADVYQYLREITDSNYDVNNYVMIFSGQSSSYSINRIVIAAQIFLCVLILLVSAVLLNNVFALSYDERLKYLGMLSSIGATGKQKRSSVYFEAMFLLAVALPIGLFTGLILIRAIVAMMKPAAAAFMGIHITKDVPVRLVLKLSSILLVVLGSALTVLVSAILPANRIAKTGAVSAIRGSSEKKPKVSKKSSWQSRSAESMLAKGFLKKDNRRSRAIIKAMCAFITVMITVTYASNALIQMVSFKLKDSETIEIQLFAKHEYLLGVNQDGALFDSIVSQLEETGGIRSANAVYGMGNQAVTSWDVYSEEYLNGYRDIMRQYYSEDISNEEIDENHVINTDFFASLTAVDDALYAEIASSLDYLPSDQDPEIILLKEGSISTETYSVFASTARDYRYYEIQDMCAAKTGESVSMNFGPDQKVSFFVSAKASQKDLSKWFSFSDYKLHGLISQSTAEKLMAEGIPLHPEQYYLFDGDETNSALNEKINELHRMKTENMNFVSHAEYMPETIQSSLKALIRIILISFILLTSAVCFMNIFNSISGLVAYRRKTFAILKAAGMTEKQMKKMMILEMAEICLISVVSAALISFALCFAIRRFMNSAFGYFRVPLPAGGMILSIMTAVIMAALCEWYTYSRETKADLIEEIRKDSI